MERTIIIFLLLLLMTACEEQIPEQALEPGIHQFTIRHDGLTRSYDVYVPEKYEKNMPVLLALHGGGGNAEKMQSLSELDVTADANGFIVVYPQGSSRLLAPNIGSWNAGNCCGRAVKKNIDDVGFLTKVIDKVNKEYKSDETRVYMTGISNGAQMSYRLACERADKISGIAPVAGHMVLDSCEPQEGVPLIHFHGKQDQCQPFEGTDSCGGCLYTYFKKTIGFSPKEDDYSCESVLETINRWKTFNDAASEPRIIFDSEDTKCYKSEGVAAVAYCVSETGGHTWPGASGDPCEGRMDYETCKEIVGSVAPVDWNTLMWEFFENN